jgi:hypothetical protein
MITSNIGALVQTFGLSDQILYGSGGLLDIVSRIAVDRKFPLVVEELHPERQVIVSRNFRWLQQYDLIETVPRQRGDLLTVGHSRRAQHPYIGLHDQTLEILVSSRNLHQTTQLEDDQFSANRYGLCQRSPLS